VIDAEQNSRGRESSRDPIAGFLSGLLLFESKGGWNQAGGPELLTTEHHDVCNVLLVDGSVMTVGPNEIGGLKWTSESRPAQDAQQGTTPTR